MRIYKKTEKPIEYEKVDIKKIEESRERGLYYRLLTNNDDKKTQLKEVIREIPSNCLYFQEKLDKIHKKEKTGYGQDFSKIFDKIELIQNAIVKAIDKLREIRYHGLGTHCYGHGIGFLIHKLIHQLENETYGHVVSWNGNVFLDSFFNQLRSDCQHLQKEFDPIFNILTKELGFSKREKELLLRSYFESFEKESKHLLEWDWRYHYFGLYDYCLEIYLDLVDKLPDLPEMKQIHECLNCNAIFDNEDLVQEHYLKNPGHQCCIKEVPVNKEEKKPEPTKEIVNSGIKIEVGKPISIDEIDETIKEDLKEFQESIVKKCEVETTIFDTEPEEIKEAFDQLEKKTDKELEQKMNDIANKESEKQFEEKKG